MRPTSRSPSRSERHRHRDAVLEEARSRRAEGAWNWQATGRSRTGVSRAVVATNSIGKATLIAPCHRAALVDSPAVLASISSSFTSQVASHGAYAVFVLMLVDAVFPGGERARHALRRRCRGRRLRVGPPRVALRRGDRLRLRRRTSSMALAGTLGYLVGALIGWAIGCYGGRPLLERHGRWLHLSPEQARPRRALVRPVGEPRRLSRPDRRPSSARSSRSRPASSGCRSGRTPR